MAKFGSMNVTDLVEMARLAENAERFEDMIMFMRERVKNHSDPLSTEERNLMSVAYKNVIGARRASWRQFNYEKETMEANGKSDTGEYEKITKYESQVAAEILEISQNVLGLLEDDLIKENEVTKDNCEEMVFYLKMAGDYYRYLAESVTDEKYEAKTDQYYKSAMTIAEQALQATHPIRLGLALNYSVCHYEILKNKKDACELAKAAFDDAISKLDALDEADYKDSTLIMQLLRDNLTLWTSSTEDDGEDN